MKALPCAQVRPGWVLLAILNGISEKQPKQVLKILDCNVLTLVAPVEHRSQIKRLHWQGGRCKQATCEHRRGWASDKLRESRPLSSGELLPDLDLLFFFLRISWQLIVILK